MIWALKQSNPPILFGFDPSTLTQRHSIIIDGVNATLLGLNQHNENELFVVGRYAWNLIAVQRFELISGVPTNTGVWLYKTMGTPSAIVSTGRYVFLTVNHAASGTRAAFGELITLSNSATFTEAFVRRRINGAITALTNIDSGEFTVLVAGRNLNRSGFVLPVRAGQSFNNRLRITLTKPITSISARIQTNGLVPAMMIVGSDGTRWTRLKYTISTRQLVRQQIQANTSLVPDLLMSQPFVSIATTPNRLGFDAYYLSQNRYQKRATIAIGRVSAAIQQYTITQNQLYWNDGTYLYRAVISLP
jgi:hypothetical protein